MLSRFVALLFLYQSTVQAFFSINYAADENHPMLMTSPGVFKEAPQAEHVADIYARLSGNSPIFWEGQSRRFPVQRIQYTKVNFDPIL